MSNSAFKRACALITALIFLTFLTLSPSAELYCEHDHSCCTDKCPVCLVANAYFGMQLSLRALPYTAAILLFIYIRRAIRFGGFNSASSSPVEMKTKITS